MAFDTDTPFSLDDLGRALRSEIGRGQHDVGAFSCGQGGKPASKGPGLFFSERAQRDIDVPVGDIVVGQTGGMGGIACDVAALSPWRTIQRRSGQRCIGWFPCPAVSDEDLNVRLGNRFLGVGVWTRLGRANSRAAS